MSRKSARSQSARHLSDDNVWESLSPLPSDQCEDSPQFSQSANMLTASTDSTSGLPLLVDRPGRKKLTQAKIIEQSERVLPSVPLPLSATAASPSQSSREDELQLRLHTETQDLEIKRLQLELQLAQLKLASNSVNAIKPDESAKTGDRSSEKSLGDQHAPQRITNPQEWPHIFTPGEPKLFNELTMAEFSAGYTVIIQRCTDVSRRAAFLLQFHDLMVLASIYTWSVVRAYHYKVLRSIEMGLVSWGDSFDSLKQTRSFHGFNQQNIRPPFPQTAFKLNV